MTILGRFTSTDLELWHFILAASEQSCGKHEHLEGLYLAAALAGVSDWSLTGKKAKSGKLEGPLICLRVWSMLLCPTNPWFQSKNHQGLPHQTEAQRM